MTHVLIHIDGSCIENLGPGGYAAIIQKIQNEKVVRVKRVKGRNANTTSNRMVLAAAIEALQQIKKYRESPILLRTSSTYLVGSVRKWLPIWTKNGWLKLDRRPVVNRDLLEALHELNNKLHVSWELRQDNKSDPIVKEVHKLARHEARSAEDDLWA